ncbi:MAG: hypothetical protein ACLFWF_04205, partial [Alphaproteobacteria bacterium]
AAAGFGLVGFASLAVHSLFCHKPQSLTFFREGFEFQGAKGASQIIPYSDIYELLATDTTGISPITVKGPRPEPLAVISREFSAYFAILYLLEHMRARAAGENV